MTENFGLILAKIFLTTGGMTSALIGILAAWAMLTARVYGNNPKDVERSMRIIEAYARVCVLCTTAAIVFGIMLTVVMVNGR